MTGGERDLFHCWLRHLWGFCPCGSITFLRKQVDFKSTWLASCCLDTSTCFCYHRRAVQLLGCRDCPQLPDLPHLPGFPIPHLCDSATSFHVEAATRGHCTGPVSPGLSAASLTRLSHGVFQLETRTYDRVQVACRPGNQRLATAPLASSGFLKMAATCPGVRVLLSFMKTPSSARSLSKQMPYATGVPRGCRRLEQQASKGLPTTLGDPKEMQRES